MYEKRKYINSLNSNGQKKKKNNGKRLKDIKFFELLKPRHDSVPAHKKIKYKFTNRTFKNMDQLIFLMIL